MSKPATWPGTLNPIAKISFALMAGFDAEGQPMYTSGTVESAEVRKAVQLILEPLQPVPHTITSVTMGEVRVEMQDGNAVVLKPVFHPSLDAYGDLFIVDELQYPMPPPFAELLNRWRKREG
jgi:hypothetical protein